MRWRRKLQRSTNSVCVVYGRERVCMVYGRVHVYIHMHMYIYVCKCLHMHIFVHVICLYVSGCLF
jgi:hypothetical protein